MRLDRNMVAYFKSLEEETSIPCQRLINLYLRDCAVNRRKLRMTPTETGFLEDGKDAEVSCLPPDARPHSRRRLRHQLLVSGSLKRKRGFGNTANPTNLANHLGFRGPLSMHLAAPQPLACTSGFPALDTRSEVVSRVAKVSLSSESQRSRV